MAHDIINFVTTNPGKVAALQNSLGDSATVLQLQLDVPEIQADSAEEVALYKARYAYERTKKPLIMQDSALHIRALNGFPGPYIKFINETIGPEGILSLMENKEDRYCYFDEVAVYIDDNGDEHIFRNSDAKGGTVATECHVPKNHKAWSVVWKIYIPNWASKPLAALSQDQIAQHQRENDKHSEMYHFSRWYKSRVR